MAKKSLPKHQTTGIVANPNIDVQNNNVIRQFADNAMARNESMNFDKPMIKKHGGDMYNPNHSVARVVNNYNDIPKGEKSIGISYMAKTPSPNLKKGGSKKK